MNTFGQVTKALRKRAGLTLEDVAKKISSHKGYVSGYENGKVNPPSVRIVRKIHKLFVPTLAQLKLQGSEEDLVELAEVDKLPILIRDRMRRRIVDNPFAAAEITGEIEPSIKPAAAPPAPAREAV
jgi:transcriptional regulator with XRE-family HTH domain